MNPRVTRDTFDFYATGPIEEVEPFIGFCVPRGNYAAWITSQQNDKKLSPKPLSSAARWEFESPEQLYELSNRGIDELRFWRRAEVFRSSTHDADEMVTQNWLRADAPNDRESLVLNTVSRLKSAAYAVADRDVKKEEGAGWCSARFSHRHEKRRCAV